jgi:hypothetical protein
MDDVIWTLIDFEPPKKAAPVISDGCPKCGKKLGKGSHLHIKYCKGVIDAS